MWLDAFGRLTSTDLLCEFLLRWTSFAPSKHLGARPSDEGIASYPEPREQSLYSDAVSRGVALFQPRIPWQFFIVAPIAPRGPNEWTKQSQELSLLMYGAR